MNKKNKLVLKENNPDNFFVVDLDNDVCFVHDNNTGKNFFSNQMIAEVCGITESNVRHYWRDFKEKRINVKDSHVNLNVLNIKRPVDFKAFDFFNYVSNRVNTKEALRMQEYIADSIDDKFNRDIGFTKTIELTPEDKKILETLHTAKKQKSQIRMETDSLYVELNFSNPSHKRAKEILRRLDELKPEELRIKRQIKNIGNCIGSLGRETSARTQSTLLEFNNWRLLKK